MDSENLEEQVVEYLVKNKVMYYRLAYSYVKNADDALDIVQESTYKAITSINSLKEPKYIKTWFYKIVVNTSLDFIRKRKKLCVMDEDIILHLDDGKLDDYEDFDLEIALDNLPDKYRTIIILKYFEDLKIKDIAIILDENENTIKTRLYKALKKLRISLDDCKEV